MKDGFYLVYENEPVRDAIKHHERPFESVEEAIKEANAFCPKGTVFYVYGKNFNSMFLLWSDKTTSV